MLVESVLSSMFIPGRVETVIRIDGEFPNLQVDPVLIRRTFSNLFTNAFQAMPSGGRLTVTAVQKDDTAIINVRDTGIGIPKENLGSIFTPLFTTKSKGQGFGLAVIFYRWFGQSAFFWICSVRVCRP